MKNASSQQSSELLTGHARRETLAGYLRIALDGDLGREYQEAVKRIEFEHRQRTNLWGPYEMYPALRPAEIGAVIKDDYATYMSGLCEAWSAAGHPDVDGAGHPKRRKLSAEGRAKEMRRRLGEVADLFPAEKWDEDCCSPRSSQALVVEILGSLERVKALHLVTEAIPEATTCQLLFEKQGGPTNFDAVIRDVAGDFTATLEAKFTERGFNPCRYPSKRCDGTWWARPNTRMGCPMAVAPSNRARAQRYWNVAQQDWNVPIEPPEAATTCPLWASYQAAHNLAETRRLSESAQWLLLYDERNPYFTNEEVGWVPKLRAAGTRNWQAISWQQLLRKAVDRAPRLRRLQTLHGF